MTDRIKMTRAELQSAIEEAIPEQMPERYAKYLRSVGANSNLVARGTFSVPLADTEEPCGCPMTQAFGRNVNPLNIRGGCRFINAFDEITRPEIGPFSPPIFLIEVTDD